MPLQNRVNPFGDIFSTPDRGMFTGNRGIIHNDHQQIIKNYTLKAWITCSLNYKGAKRQVMTGRKWTELFFLDEATAFAAGHRPCAFCRNAVYKHFKQIWLAQNASIYKLQDEGVKWIDDILHRERMTEQKKKRMHEYKLFDLPDGTIFTRLENGNQLPNNTAKQGAYLWHRHHVWRWNSFGYSHPEKASQNETVMTLTPPSIIRCFQNGYEPVLHHSLHDY